MKRFLTILFLPALLLPILVSCNSIHSQPHVFVLNLSGLDLDVRLGTPTQVHYENLKIQQSDATYLQPIGGTGPMQLFTRINGIQDWKVWQDNRGEPYTTLIEGSKAYAIILAPYGFVRILPMLKSPGPGPHLAFYNASKKVLRMIQVASELNVSIKHYSQAIKGGHLTEFFTFKPGPNGVFWLFDDQNNVSDRYSFRDDLGEVTTVDFQEGHFYLQMIWGTPEEKNVESRIWDISPAP